MFLNIEDDFFWGLAKALFFILLAIVVISFLKGYNIYQQIKFQFIKSPLADNAHSNKTSPQIAEHESELSLCQSEKLNSMIAYTLKASGDDFIIIKNVVAALKQNERNEPSVNMLINLIKKNYYEYEHLMNSLQHYHAIITDKVSPISGMDILTDSYFRTLIDQHKDWLGLKNINVSYQSENLAHTLLYVPTILTSILNLVLSEFIKLGKDGTLILIYVSVDNGQLLIKMIDSQSKPVKQLSLNELPVTTSAEKCCVSDFSSNMYVAKLLSSNMNAEIQPMIDMENRSWTAITFPISIQKINNSEKNEKRTSPLILILFKNGFRDDTLTKMVREIGFDILVAKDEQEIPKLLSLTKACLVLVDCRYMSDDVTHFNSVVFPELIIGFSYKQTRTLLLGDLPLLSNNHRAEYVQLSVPIKAGLLKALILSVIAK